MGMNKEAQGGGLGDKPMQPATSEPLGGTGGSDGGGTIAGAGDPAGGRADRTSAHNMDDDATSGQGTITAAGQLAGRSGQEEAIEAAALGAADGSLADAAGQHVPGNTTIGDAVRSPD